MCKLCARLYTCTTNTHTHSRAHGVVRLSSYTVCARVCFKIAAGCTKTQQPGHSRIAVIIVKSSTRHPPGRSGFDEQNLSISQTAQTARCDLHARFFAGVHFVGCRFCHVPTYTPVRTLIAYMRAIIYIYIYIYMCVLISLAMVCALAGRLLTRPTARLRRPDDAGAGL